MNSDAQASNDQLIVIDCDFVENSAVSDGGGLYSNHTGVNLIDSRFFDNSSMQNGGGAFVAGGLGTTVTQVIGCEFRGNSAGSVGGGLD